MKTRDPAARAKIILRIGQKLNKHRQNLMRKAKTPKNMKNGRAKIQPLQNAFDRFKRGDPLTPINRDLITSVVTHK